MLLLIGFLSGASALYVPAVNAQKPSLSAAFTAWSQEQLFVDRRSSFFSSAEDAYYELLKRKVNHVAHPDVPLQLFFEGMAKPAVVPGDATTDVLRTEAIRLYQLQPNEQLRFVVNGKTLPLGVPIMESALANTENLDVLVVAGSAISARTCDVLGGTSWWEGAAMASRGMPTTQRRTAAERATARRLARREPECSIAAALQKRVREMQEEGGE